MKHRPLKARNFQTASQDAAQAKPPSLYDGPGSAYHLAFTDFDFLLQDELRPVRVQLELMKPEMVQTRHGIESTIVLFGSARIKAPDELVLVTDALAGLGMPPGRYMLAGREYISDGTCGRQPDGTLSGSLLPLNRALGNVVEKAGVEPATAVRFATANAARAIGLEDALGHVEVGRAADLVVVDQAWEVQTTVLDGRVVYQAGADR